MRPLSFPVPPWRHCVAVAVCGAALFGILGLAPLWWLAWIAPAPLLAMAYRGDAASARRDVAAAALIGASANASYLPQVMPVPFAVLAMLLQALLWTAIVLASRRVVLRRRAWWTVFVYPVLWAAADTLMAHLLPDTNWGSLAYTQAGFLPALQLAALAGTGGLVFMLSLSASALAMPLAFGGTLTHVLRACGLAAFAVASVLLYGTARLHAPPDAGPTVTIGLAAIDDFIGRSVPPAVGDAVWRRYDAHIAALAARGARIVVLPEKIAVVTPAQADALRSHLGGLAARWNIWIAAGIGVDDGHARVNLAWLMTPDGAPAHVYRKQHLAPPEREFAAGHTTLVAPVDGLRAGLAICKDMHFAALGRDYGRLGADVMLVPAWDFRSDGPYAAAVTLTRGIENGYTVVRAARDGWLSISDARGRIVARQDSAALPGSALLAHVTLPRRRDTLYTHVGDAFGWFCVALSAVFAAFARLRK